MKKFRIEKEYLKIILLLSSLFSYLLSCAVLNDFYTSPKTDHNVYHYEADNSRIVKYYLLPENSSDTILTERFISFHVQQVRDHTYRFKQVNYYKDRVLALNHPIAAYKISLSVYTAIG